ncbi:MAG: S8 family serine peptidase, partial [Clostridiaceae bacterium]|nr:S8 family serine peptidase [Clostridiaceae bacterium]
MNRVSHIIHLDYARARNLTGKGIGVAIFDTGISYHPDLFHRDTPGLVDFVDTLHGRKAYYDDNGHGTHIAGILAGSGKSCSGLFRGVTPGCHY